MKTTRLETTLKPSGRSRHCIDREAIVAGIALVLLALPTPTARGEILDTFGGTTVDTAIWTKACFFGPCGHLVANGQVRLSVTPDGDHGFAGLTSVRQWTVREGRTLEFRVDLISCSGDGALARLNCAFGNPNKYILFVDQDTIALGKREEDPLQLFFLTNGPAVDVTNVKLVLSMTGGPDSSVLVQWKILDNEQGGRVLFSGSQWDTAGSDPMVEDAHKTSDNPPGSFLGMSGRLNISVYHDNAGWVDPQVEIPHLGEAAAVFDNPEVIEYDSAWQKPPLRAMLLSWPQNTAEEQIIAGAPAPEGPYSPWPEPCFDRQGAICTAVPTTALQQYFKLVPGIQYVDSFGPVKQPFATRNAWEPWFMDGNDASRFAFTIANGAFRIETTMQPQVGQVAIFTPGGGEILRDFHASVDILDWASSTESALGLAGRLQGGPGGVNNLYLGSVRMNRSAGTGQLWFFNGASDVEASDVFSVSPDSEYRLEFSVVGDQLQLRFLRLAESPTLVAEASLEDSRFTQGRVALWVNTRGSTGYMRAVDNFFVTGSKP